MKVHQPAAIGGYDPPRRAGFRESRARRGFWSACDRWIEAGRDAPSMNGRDAGPIGNPQFRRKRQPMTAV
jgi:hypothetical protein